MVVLKAFLAIWRSLLVAGTWIGLVYVAQDIDGLPEAFRAWASLMPLTIEQTLFIFSGALVLWVAWIDIRPHALPYLEKHLPWAFPRDSRISVTDVADIAKSMGWSFGVESLQSLDFIEALRESAASGEIKFLGRSGARRDDPSDAVWHPLHEIPARAFIENQLDVPRYFEGTNNYFIGTYRFGGGTPSFDACDLFFSSERDARRWLRQTASRYKGANDRRDAQEASRRREEVQVLKR